MPQLNKERETLNNHSDLATEILDKLSAQPVELEHAALSNSPEESIELICSGEIEVSFEEALKIFILLCWRNNGLSQKFLDAYRVDLLNIYGHDRLLCFMKAAQCGILYAQSEKNARLGRDILIKGLKLNETNSDLFNPTNQSFVFGNKWTPLVSRLVLESSAGSWRRIDELLKSTKIPFREDQQEVAIAENQRASAIFVFMIGGITASEIAALNHLSNQLGREIIVGCTETITGKSFISQIVN